MRAARVSGTPLPESRTLVFIQHAADSIHRIADCVVPQRLAYTLDFPPRTNAITKYGCLAFPSSIPGEPAGIPGTANPDHMRDNVAAGFGRLPDAAMRQRIAQWYDKL